MEYVIKKYSSLNIILLFLMIFIVNSLIGWVMLTIYILSNINDSRKVIIWSVLTIIFISLFNATKVPENDLSWYVDFYLAANKTSFKNYLGMLTGGKEQLYQILVYGIHLIGGKNYHIYIFIMSMISYSCLLRTLNIMKKQLGLTNMEFFGAVSFLCFFPYTYAISVHIVRQVLASSIIIWLLFEYYCGIKKKWILIFAVSTIFIHTSAIFILPFFFIKQIIKPITKKNFYLYLLIVIVIFSVSFIGGKLLSVASSGSAVGYIVDKMANGTTFETTLPLSQLILSVAFVVGGYVSIYVHRKTLGNNTSCTLLLHISTILLLFILSNSANPELQLRCNFFFWTYASFFISIYLASYRVYPFIILLASLSMFVLWNFYNYGVSQWTYTCSDKYYLYSIFDYFF